MKFVEEPISFAAGRRFLEDQVSVPTGLSSQELALKVPERIRARSFFSANVASANVLQALREEVAAVAAGERNYTDARTRLKTFLAREGYGIPSPGEMGDGDVRDLASTRRLDLILKQNVAQAHAIGQREVAEHPAIMETFPNYRYAANTERHARFDGVVLPKTDRFWDRHYPPIDYNCDCIVIDSDEPVNARTGSWSGDDDSEAGRLEFGGQSLPLGPNESGYSFRSRPGDPALTAEDLGRIRDEGWRGIVEDELRRRGALGDRPRRSRRRQVRRAAAAPVDPAVRAATKDEAVERGKAMGFESVTMGRVNLDHVNETMDYLYEMATRVKGGVPEGLSLEFGGITGSEYAHFSPLENLLRFRTRDTGIEERLRRDDELFGERYGGQPFHSLATKRGLVYHEFAHALDKAAEYRHRRFISGLSLEERRQLYGLSGYTPYDAYTGGPLRRHAEAWAEAFSVVAAGGERARIVPDALRRRIEEMLNDDA